MFSWKHKLSFVGRALIASTVSCTVVGCKPSKPPRQDATFVKLSTMDIPSVTLSGLRTQATFQAEVVAVLLHESTNLLAEHGISNAPHLVTNLYGIQLRDND